MKYIENEGALFRGSGRSMPKEVWNGAQWLPYEGEVPKPVEWGDEISEQEAKRLMGEGAEAPQDAEQPVEAEQNA